MTRIIKLMLLFTVAAAGFLMPCPGQVAVGSLQEQICVVLITGIGCPACAEVEPALLIELTAEIPQLVVLEYEIYKSAKSNQSVARQYFDAYLPAGAPRTIPLLILDKEKHFRGSWGVKKGIEAIREIPANKCPLPDGNVLALEQVDLHNLPGVLKIFTKGRVIISNPSADDEFAANPRNSCIRELIRAACVDCIIGYIEHEPAEPDVVYISGGELSFQRAAKIGQWKLQWN